MTSDLEINSTGHEEIERDAVQANGASTDESMPRLNADPLTMALNVKDKSRLIVNARSDASAEPTETPNEQKPDLNRPSEVDVEPATTTLLILDGQRSADDCEPASELRDQSEVRVVGPVSGGEKIIDSTSSDEKPSAATWRGQHFTGTLGLRMAQAAKVPNILSFASGQGSFSPIVGEQATQQESLALDAASTARAANVAEPELQTLEVKSFARTRHGLQAKSNKLASTRPNHQLRAAGLTMALAAIFVGGTLTQSLSSRTSEEPRKIDEQKRLLDEVAGKLNLQEEKLLIREVETRRGAEEFKRLIAEERASQRAEIERKIGEQKRLLDEVAGKLKGQHEKLLTQEVETRGRAEEFERLVAEEQARLKAEIERKIDEEIEGLREADEKKKFSDGLAAKRQAKGQKRAAATTESDRRIGSAHGAPDAALATAAPMARPAAVPRPDDRQLFQRQN